MSLTPRYPYLKVRIVAGRGGATVTLAQCRSLLRRHLAATGAGREEIRQELDDFTMEAGEVSGSASGLARVCRRWFTVEEPLP